MAEAEEEPASATQATMSCDIWWPLDSAAVMIKLTFADCFDLDLEHLTPFAEFGDEFAGYIALANTLREEFDNDTAPALSYPFSNLSCL